jgi:MFS transporter, DHA1 family, tetracycline resistance protein
MLLSARGLGFVGVWRLELTLTEDSLLTTPRLVLRLLPLLLVILIDSISYTIVVPILSAALLSDTPVLMLAASEDTRYIIYGIAVGIFELMLLYMAPVLGEISDRTGRRIVLVACLGGVIASFVMIGASILFNLVALLVLGRMLGGATAGSQPVAQAAAVDLCPDERKPFALSLALLASSLGFVAGPLLGGLMSWDDHTATTDLVIPFGVTALLAGAGIALILIGYRDARPAPSGRRGLGKVDIWMGVRGFRAALADPTIRRLIIVFGLMQTAWGAFFLFLPSLLYERFDMDTGVVTLMLGFLGIGFCLAYGIFLPWLSQRFASRSIALWALWCTAVLMLVTVLWADLAVQWAIALPIAAIVSIGYGAIMTQFSDAVEDERQGWILGIAGSINALAWGVSSIVAGFLSGLHYIAPFILAVVSLFASACLATLPLRREPSIPLNADSKETSQ